MTQSITISIRLSKEMDAELKQEVKVSHHGKNWVIVQALREYLSKRKRDLLYKEARKQSMLIAEHESNNDGDFEDLIDDTGWVWED